MHTILGESLIGQRSVQGAGVALQGVDATTARMPALTIDTA